MALAVALWVESERRRAFDPSDDSLHLCTLRIFVRDWLRPMFFLFGGIGQFGVIHGMADEQVERWPTKKGRSCVTKKIWKVSVKTMIPANILIPKLIIMNTQMLYFSLIVLD